MRWFYAAIIISTLFYTVTSSKLSLIKNLLIFTDRDSGTLMQRIVIHNRSREVYVGARNAIYHFDENLSLKKRATTGPEPDHVDCLHPPLPCNHKRLQTDNDNKILEVYSSSSSVADALIACGTLYQGMCQAMRMTDINRSVWIGNFNDTTNFIAGKQSTVGFFAPGPRRALSLYSASTYDDRPFKYAPVSVSSKIPVWNNDTLSFTHSHMSEISHTGVNFDATYKKLYKVNYVYGFSYAGFSYFVTTQRVATDSEVVETRLVRVCQDDLQFFSYMEMPLRCQRGLDVFNLATTAHLGPAGIQLKQKLKMAAEVNEILYISFGMTVPDHGTLLDKSKGFVVCSFPMDQVIQSITNATRDCFHAQPRTFLLKHVVGVEKKCENHDDIQITDDFCGSGLNTFIEGREAIPGGFRFHKDHHITSLAVTLQFGKTIAVLGTHEGEIIKEMLDRRTVHPLYAIHVGQDKDGKNHSIESSNAFDQDHENIYFLTGNKVVKFPIGSCSVYTDCGSCLTADDPLECQWCGDHCAHLQECGSIAQLSPDSCPPIINDIEPLRGPIDGGTIITITGDNFGSSLSGEAGTKIEVKVAGIDCDIIEWEKEMLKCKTRYVPGEINGPISIWVKDISWAAGRFDMNGTAFSSRNFSFVVPKLYGVYPSYGPLSGGTNVTVFGENLDIGNKRKISTAGIECADYSVSESGSWCITGQLENTLENRGPIEITIDDAILEPEAVYDQKVTDGRTIYKEFQFLPNPEIFSIHPQTALVSGITNLTVTGIHLNNVAFPKMIVIVTSSLTRETYEKQKPCTLKGKSGVEMICATPAIDMPGLHAPTDRAPLVAHLAFEMDGVQRLKDLPIHNPTLSQLLYYPDPVFPHPTETVINKTHLEIKGSYLDLALSPRDVKVFLNGNKSCNVTLLTKESLFCSIPPTDMLKSANGSYISVEVTIGRLNFPLGFVDFSKDENDGETTFQIGLRIAVIIFILLSVLAAGYFVCRYWRNRSKKLSSSPWSVSYIADGNASGSRRRQETNDYQDLGGRSLTQRPSVAASETACMAVSEAQSNNNYDVNDETLHLLKSENILIQRTFLVLAEVIGEGYFGCVYKGELTLPGKGEKLTVAAKTLHNSAARIEQDREAFLQEGLMMKDFHHHNVLTLIGVCFEHDGSPMVIIPYMKYGDLLSFIRDENQNFMIKDFMTFGVDIAAGMKYLAGLKFIHRDLAARNCMLSEDYTVKVADFGLSRDIYERDYYSSDNKKKLPIKWMAPESLEKGTYTSKSDVWAYGVVLWELFTRGVLPYPDVDNWDLLNYLKCGRRMPQPSYCPDLLYQLMLQCWDFDPKKRPSFSELEEAIKGIIAKLELPKRRVSLNVTYVNYPQTYTEQPTSEVRPNT